MTTQIKTIIKENERKETMPDRYYDRPGYQGRTLTANTENEQAARIRRAMKGLSKGL